MNNINFSKKSFKNDLAFVGLSHLGLVFSICSASLKKDVLAIDENQTLLTKLSQGTIDIPEPNLQTLLLKHRRNIFFSSDFRLLIKASIIFISLDTPTDAPSNLKILNKLIEKVIPFLADNSVLVISSQIPVGFTRNLFNIINKRRPLLKYYLYFFLNTLIIGDSVNKFLHPERIIIGLNSSNDLIPPQFLQFLELFKAPILKMSYESAELTKSAINLYLASSIVTSNTLADFCEITGANINEIIPALKSDKRIGPYAYLKPTLRISGGHLERELIKLESLERKNNIPNGIVKALLKLNEKRLDWLYRNIKKLSTQKKSIKTITLWGLSYKKDTESTDNAASVKIIKKFARKLNLQVYDPKAVLPKNLSGFRRFKDKYAALNNSDLLIIVNDWDEFQNADYSKAMKILNYPNIIDCVNIVKTNIPVIRMGA